MFGNAIETIVLSTKAMNTPSERRAAPCAAEPSGGSAAAVPFVGARARRRSAIAIAHRTGAGLPPSRRSDRSSPRRRGRPRSAAARRAPRPPGRRARSARRARRSWPPAARRRTRRRTRELFGYGKSATSSKATTRDAHGRDRRRRREHHDREHAVAAHRRRHAGELRRARACGRAARRPPAPRPRALACRASRSIVAPTYGAAATSAGTLQERPRARSRRAASPAAGRT